MIIIIDTGDYWQYYLLARRISCTVTVTVNSNNSVVSCKTGQLICLAQSPMSSALLTTRESLLIWSKIRESRVSCSPRPRLHTDPPPGPTRKRPSWQTGQARCCRRCCGPTVTLGHSGKVVAVVEVRPLRAGCCLVTGSTWSQPAVLAHVLRLSDV